MFSSLGADVWIADALDDAAGLEGVVEEVVVVGGVLVRDGLDHLQMAVFRTECEGR